MLPVVFAVKGQRLRLREQRQAAQALRYRVPGVVADEGEVDAIEPHQLAVRIDDDAGQKLDRQLVAEQIEPVDCLLRIGQPQQVAAAVDMRAQEIDLAR